VPSGSSPIRTISQRLDTLHQRIQPRSIQRIRWRGGGGGVPNCDQLLQRGHAGKQRGRGVEEMRSYLLRAEIAKRRRIKSNSALKRIAALRAQTSAIIRRIIMRIRQ